MENGLFFQVCPSISTLVFLSHFFGAFAPYKFSGFPQFESNFVPQTSDLKYPDLTHLNITKWSSLWASNINKIQIEATPTAKD